MPNTLGGYEIVREIARSNDIVYEARDPSMNRKIALKELALAPNLVGEQRRERIERFYREARAAGNLAHPNIVTIFKVGDENGRHFIAMEFLEGDTLRTMLQVGGPLTVQRAIEITSQICDALDYAHQRGVVHRDVKPDNIQILPDGTAKLTDFGIARLGGEPGITQAGQVFGTPSYMSPEQISGKSVDRRSDVFAMGVVLYEVLSGRKPFTGDSVVTITYNIMNMDPVPPPGVPPYLQQIIRKAMSKAPEHRYQSAAELARDLRQPPPAMTPYSGTQHVTSLPRINTINPAGSSPFSSPAVSPWGVPSGPVPFSPSSISSAPTSYVPPMSNPIQQSAGSYPAPTMPVPPPLPPPSPRVKEFVAKHGPFLSLLAIVLVLIAMAVLVFLAISSGYQQSSASPQGSGMPMAPAIQPGATPPVRDSGTSTGLPPANTLGGPGTAANAQGAMNGGPKSPQGGANPSAAPSSSSGSMTGGPGEPGSGETAGQQLQQILQLDRSGNQAQLQYKPDEARTDYQSAVDLYTNLPSNAPVPPEVAQAAQDAQLRLSTLR